MRSLFILLVLLICSFPVSALAMGGDGCGAGSCKDCHTLDVPEAAKILGDGVDKVHSVRFSEMPGVWRVEVEKEGNRFPLYIDFSKQYVVAGNIIRLKDRANVTIEEGRSTGDAGPRKVDLKQIPLEDAFYIGDPMAQYKAIVFTDPRCPYCARLHGELRKAVKMEPNVGFYIKLYPLKMHPDAYPLSKTLICRGDAGLLDRVYEGESIEPADCDKASAIDANLELVKKLGINSTPTIILPDGTVRPGARPADQVIDMVVKAGRG
ncbi:MAG: DsbC family protein [Deltaproteobacteria bacterium]|nr:MAG: DsbC family protein [Deltaproteobacteria bacterium]